jgi:hypothetical protein
LSQPREGNEGVGPQARERRAMYIGVGTIVAILLIIVLIAFVF